MPFIAILFYFLLLIIFSLIKSPSLKSPTLNLFKSMFPSWKFFDENNDTPALLFKTDQTWIICFSPQKTKWRQILINPSGNFYLAYHSQIQQLLGDLNETDDDSINSFQNSTSYKIVTNFVRYKLNLIKYSGHFQFKISYIKHIDRDHFEILEDVLLSPTLDTSYDN